MSGSRLQVGTRLRRSLLNDLIQTSIIAVNLEGAIHEFSRLPGVHEPVLDLLFHFRKIGLHAPFLKIGSMAQIPFLFLGPGMFHAKDIMWSNGIQCRNPSVPLVTLAPGSSLRGRLMVQKKYSLGSIQNYSQALLLGRPCSKFLKVESWLSIGFTATPVQRIGFRIESRGRYYLEQPTELLIFEIFTNGGISPRQALRESALLLVYKFSSIANVFLPLPFLGHNHLSFQINNNSLSMRPTKRLLSIQGTFFEIRDPLNLDLGNLDLNKDRYKDFRIQGFQTLGDLLARFASEPPSFSPLLKKQRHKALFRLGFFLLRLSIL